MTSPWGKIAAPESVDFGNIMSEELAKDLQAKEQRRYNEKIQVTPLVEKEEEEVEASGTESTCQSDALIARMLQMQFDKEYDDNLKRTQEKCNGGSKVSISFENYFRTPLNPDFESDPEEEEVVDIRDRRDWDRFDLVERQIESIPACGYKIENGSILTKHDITLNGRKNACKLLSFPPDFQTGDGENIDLKLSNKVFNSLKRHSCKEEARRHRIRDKKSDRATAEFGLDEPTKLIIYKMVVNGLLENVNGIISTGKEAVILHADGNVDYESEKPIPSECAIKVFKTTLSDHKHRAKYIRDDPRFRDRIGNQRTKKIINLWAEKEMHNLNRLKNANIPCPEVVMLKKYVLVMSFIGKDHEAAPKLKHAALDQSEYILAYEQVVQGMVDLFNKAGLIHADLSEYNILWHEGLCYFIDVSQAVVPSQANAMAFLKRDCDTITNFFAQRKIPGLHSSEELFKVITGCSFEDKTALEELQGSYRKKVRRADNSKFNDDYNFDNSWAQSQLEIPTLVESTKA